MNPNPDVSFNVLISQCLLKSVILCSIYWLFERFLKLSREKNDIRYSYIEILWIDIAIYTNR